MEKDELFLHKVMDAFVQQGSGYNLLYLYGTADRTGELAERIFHAYQTRYPQTEILRKNGLCFNCELIDRIVSGKTVSDLTMTGCDLLIFENIEGIGGRSAAEEIAYVMLDRLLLRGGKILVTGSAPVPQMLTLEPRICAQLIGGIHLEV